MKPSDQKDLEKLVGRDWPELVTFINDVVRRAEEEADDCGYEEGYSAGEADAVCEACSKKS